MSEINRKLATIERIVSIIPHENADTLDIIGIRGWKVVSKQGQGYKVGDLVLYLEIDSFIPATDNRFEFLREQSFRSTPNLGDGFRLKTKKIRGEVSQGLIMPLSEFDEFWTYYDLVGIEGAASFNFNEGDDVTEMLHIQKYEAPLSPALAGIARGNFPSFIPKTDETRLQNLGREKHSHHDDVFEMTLKMDGASMTVYNYEGVFGVCSKNLDVKETEENTYWKVANKLNLKEYLPSGLAFQGELCGPGIQGNPHGLKEHDFFLFNIYDIVNKRYLNSEEREEFLYEYGDLLEQVERVKFLEKYHGIPSSDEAQELCDHFLQKNDEGIVFKSYDDPDFSFKYINTKYLLKEKD